MDKDCNNMDETCALIGTIVDRIDRKGIPPIPYVGLGGGRFSNPPKPHLELAFVVKGRIDKLRIGNIETSIPRQHLSLHNVHFGNHSPHHPDAQSWCVFFDLGGMAEFTNLAKAPFFQCLPVSHPDRLLRAFTELSARCHTASGQTPSYLGGKYAYAPGQSDFGGPSARLLIRAALLELLAIVLSEATRRETVEPDEPLPVRLAMEFMAIHHSKAELSLADIARAAHLSPDHFGRVFKKSTGTTPMRHLSSVRIGQACLVLSRSNLRIREVSALVGFEDQFHFSRVFRQIVGQAPRAYRAQKR